MNTKRHPVKTIAALMVFLLLIFLIGNYVLWEKNYSHKVYPGVKLGDIDLGGLSFTEAKEVIAKKTNQIEKAGLIFQHGDKQIVVDSVVSSFDSDLSYPALSFDINKTTAQAFQGKTTQSFWDYLNHKLKSREQREIVSIYSLDEKKIELLLLERFPELDIPSINAQFSLVENNQAETILKTSPERIGKEIDFPQAFSDLKNNLDSLEEIPIILKTQTRYPEIKEVDLSSLEKEARELIDGGDLLLNFGNKTWPIKAAKLISWFGTTINNEVLSLSLNQEKVTTYLIAEVAPEIDKEVVRPKFEVENEKVTSWITGEDGQKLKIEETFKKITNELLSGNRNIALEVEKITNNEYVPESGFQIKEIIGTGFSSFVGSPSNRRHNIRVGAGSVHGVLIKPDEEFSLIKALGAIDETSEYLPELVIKGNKTIPEYGGGLCQIGTTIFRAALASGLPISARRNHSYRVSYYEPAGTDATVYDPWPDIRFVNDTGHYILIQSRIEGLNNLYFDFWGVKDGRIVTSTPPVIYNIVKPEPTKIVETTTLPPGEKKCTEHSHNGADAYFDYIVEYPGGATTTPAKKEVRFSSHYVPWQEVCLLGVEATSTENVIKEPEETPVE